MRKSQSPHSCPHSRHPNFLRHEEISLYVHIPFCTSRCRYCNFYFETGWSPRVLTNTIEGILREARVYAEQAFLGPSSIRSIYFGGGTPSVVGAEHFSRLVEGLREIFGEAIAHPLAEFCVECNPESLTSGLINAFSKTGVDRISLGVQTFDSELLALLGRRADREIVENSLTLIDSEWKGELNLDFIAGIPGQTRDSLLNDLARAVAREAVHISLYSLTIEDRTPLKQFLDLPAERGGLRLAPTEEADEIWISGRDYLEACGYENYEVSNFAKPGYESAHNLSYWGSLPYLGLGPGAVSLLLTETGPLRRTNPDIFRYYRPQQPDQVIPREDEKLSPREWFTEMLIFGTRSRKGLESGLIEKRIALKGRGDAILPLWPELDALTRPWIQRGLREDLADRLVLSREGRLIQNRLLLELELELDRVLEERGLKVLFQT